MNLCRWWRAIWVVLRSRIVDSEWYSVYCIAVHRSYEEKDAVETNYSVYNKFIHIIYWPTFTSYMYIHQQEQQLHQAESVSGSSSSSVLQITVEYYL